MRRLLRGERLVLATHNKGKVREMDALLAPYGVAVVSAGDLGLPVPEETETTFVGNATLKAGAAAAAAQLPALADDSGLEVDLLDGSPGVVSADWAGPGRDFMLAMRRVRAEVDARGGEWSGKPRANFTSVLCLASPDGEAQCFEGKAFGHIVWPPRGSNGFGYDPIFVPNGYEVTFGEMDPSVKQRLSHRAVAFAKFAAACLD